MALTGALNRCPVCRAALWAEVCPPLGHERCPRCGAELWVVVFSEGLVFFPRRPGESWYAFLAALAGRRLGLSASEIEAAVLKDADPFDAVEVLSAVHRLVMLVGLKDADPFDAVMSEVEAVRSGTLSLGSIRTSMLNNQGTARPRDLAARLFNNLFFTLAWFAFLVAVIKFVSIPVRDFALVCWFYGSKAYFHGGIRVVHHGRGLTTFSSGQLVPGVLDVVTGFLTFIITVLGLSILLVFVLRLYERIRKRTSNAA